VLIGSRICRIDWYNHGWPWVTLSSCIVHLLAVAELLVAAATMCSSEYTFWKSIQSKNQKYESHCSHIVRKYSYQDIRHFPSIAIYPLLRLISGNLTTWQLLVVVVFGMRLKASPVHYSIVLLADFCGCRTFDERRRSISVNVTMSWVLRVMNVTKPWCPDGWPVPLATPW